MNTEVNIGAISSFVDQHANVVDVTHSLLASYGSSTARKIFSIVEQGTLVIREPKVDTKDTILCLPVQIQEKNDVVGYGKKAISHGKGKLSKVVCSTSNLNLIESLANDDIAKASHVLVRDMPIDANPLRQSSQVYFFDVNNERNHSNEENIDGLYDVPDTVINFLDEEGMTALGQGSKKCALWRNLYITFALEYFL
ncbi:hypothetical protein ACH5RR_018811 [Cinchona calisaya]|uniref:Uncharacterized protein n=1 Tax=Cinchona calisaya TaxID=153742 RepID=A0ABD2ZMK0_9GENT